MQSKESWDSSIDLGTLLLLARIDLIKSQKKRENEERLPGSLVRTYLAGLEIDKKLESARLKVWYGWVGRGRSM